MKTISGIEFASEHNGTDVFRLIELAYEQGQKDGHSEQLGTNLASLGTDFISRQAAIDAAIEATDSWDGVCNIGRQKRIENYINKLPSAQPTFDARDTQYNLPIGTDCISRQAAIDDIWTVSPLARLDRKWVDRWLRQLPSAQPDTYWKEQFQSYERTINKLRESLSTQPEIIRCRDCKHWMPYEWMFSEVWQSKNIADYPEDDIGCDCYEVAMKANDFCSRGEKREVTT